MTQSHMIARVKVYMEKLARGINPLTGKWLKSVKSA